jgi:hypothetical protein
MRVFRQFLNGVLGSTHGPGPMLIIPTDGLWALRREATGVAGSDTFRGQMLKSRQMPCRPAEAAGRGVLKCLLAGSRRAPGAPAPQEDDPGRCEAQLDPLGALPAFLPARVVADLGVEPDAGAFGFEHAFVGGEVLRVVQRRAASAAVDGVARAERLHRRRTRPEGAGDPLVALVLPHPSADVICELRACANRRATFRTWHLSEGLNSLLTTAWHIRYSPIGAASY